MLAQLVVQMLSASAPMACAARASSSHQHHKEHDEHATVALEEANAAAKNSASDAQPVPNELELRAGSAT